MPRSIWFGTKVNLSAKMSVDSLIMTRLNTKNSVHCETLEKVNAEEYCFANGMRIEKIDNV